MNITTHGKLEKLRRTSIGDDFVRHDWYRERVYLDSTSTDDELRKNLVVALESVRAQARAFVSARSKSSWDGHDRNIYRLNRDEFE